MRTVWLASYPKSGSTWLRMLIANLSATDGCPIDINDLPESGAIASARGLFEYLSLIDSSLLTHDEVDRLRPGVHEELARGPGNQDDEYDVPVDLPVRFVKVHDAFTRMPDGEPVLAGRRGAAGAVVLVRDPRDVAPSLASHLGVDLDETISFMNDVTSALCAEPGRMFNQLRQQLLAWSGHVASWLDQSEIPIHVVRYEDLSADTIGTFRRALAFAGYPATEEQIGRAVSFANFDALRKQERDKGFREAPRPRPDGKFFRRGVAGGWRDELTRDQIGRLEAVHAPMMLRLGYALSEESDFARTR